MYIVMHVGIVSYLCFSYHYQVFSSYIDNDLSQQLDFVASIRTISQ